MKSTALDPSFGAKGLTDLVFPQAISSQVKDIVVTPDHHILLASRLILEVGEHLSHPAYGLCLLNEHGTVDHAFGHEGYLRGYFLPAEPASVLGMAVLNDGKFLLYGISDTWSDTSDRMKSCLARFLPNGAVDSSFGNSGTVTIPPFGHTAQPVFASAEPFSGQGASGQIAVLSDNNILVLLGYPFTPEGERWILRLMPDGKIDPDFNNGLGRLVIENAPWSSSIQVGGFVIQPDEKIVVYGTTVDQGRANAVLVRYQQDGSLDPTFGAEGYSHPLEGTSLLGLAVQPDGHLIAAGRRHNAIEPVSGTLMKFTADGQPDFSFNGGQPIIDRLITDPYFWLNCKILKNGDVMVAGTALATANEKSKLMVARYLKSGQLDSRFGNEGGWETTPLPDKSFPFACADMQGDTRLICAGKTTLENLTFSHSSVVAFLV